MVEACVDDIMVKTQSQETLLQDLTKTVNSLHTNRLKLIPKNVFLGCQWGSFWVSLSPTEASR